MSSSPNPHSADTPLFIPKQQKRRMVALRRVFFDEIVASLNKAPMAIDKVFGQAVCYVPPLAESARILDADMGTLLLDFSVAGRETKYPFSYSLYQIGDTFKIGILWQGALRIVPAYAKVHKEHGEVLSHDFWQDASRFIENEDRGPITLTEWGFKVPGLYDSWAMQETYILGLRHMHFRLLSLVSAFIEESGDVPSIHQKAKDVVLGRPTQPGAPA